MIAFAEEIKTDKYWAAKRTFGRATLFYKFNDTGVAFVV